MQSNRQSKTFGDSMNNDKMPGILVPALKSGAIMFACAVAGFVIASIIGYFLTKLWVFTNLMFLLTFGGMVLGLILAFRFPIASYWDKYKEWVRRNPPVEE